MEQDHRDLKGRYYPMRTFKTEQSAVRFISAFEEQRELFRFRRYHGHKVSLPLRRVHILGKFEELKAKFLKKKMVWRQSALSL